MLQLNCGLNCAFNDLKSQVLDDFSLTDRDKAIARLTSAVFLDNPKLTKEAVIMAKQCGLTNEDIGHINAIAFVMMGEKMRNSIDFASETQVEESKTKCCC